jgi:hypothetical protein
MIWVCGAIKSEYVTLDRSYKVRHSDTRTEQAAMYYSPPALISGERSRTGRLVLRDRTGRPLGLLQVTAIAPSCTSASRPAFYDCDADILQTYREYLTSS